MSKFNKWDIEIIAHAPTRQLLNELRRTYNWEDWDWTADDCAELQVYQTTLKNELAKREHIPNKKESKALRKEKIKKGK